MQKGNKREAESRSSLARRGAQSERESQCDEVRRGFTRAERRERLQGMERAEESRW